MSFLLGVLVGAVVVVVVPKAFSLVAGWVSKAKTGL